MIKKVLLGILLLLTMISCANNPFYSYKSESDQTLNNIYNGITESTVYSNNSNNILYYMEDGTYQRMLGKYEVSDSELSSAQKVIDDWVNSWKFSNTGQITTTTMQMLINDNSVDYQPKGYEKTTLSAYRALNHVDTNNWANARVEVKKMYETEVAIKNYNEALYQQDKANSTSLRSNPATNMIYRKIMTNYNFTAINSPQVLLLENSYQSAFSHYLAGFIFEALGENSLARPGYLNALKLNPNNSLSGQSIANLDKGKTRMPGYTNLLIIEEIGHAPQYKSKQIPITFNYALNNGQTCLNNINLFFPELVPDIQGKSNYNYTIDNKNQNPELYTDYDLMAARYLHDQIPHLIARNITAAIRNISTSQAICNADSSSLGSILNIVSIAGGIFLDHADERTWVLLPSKIYLNRVSLPYGKHTINISVRGQTYKKEILLNSPYQIFDLRVFGDRVFFMDER